MIPLPAKMIPKSKKHQNFLKKFFETYGKLHSFTVIMTVEEVNLQKMSKTFSKKLFETTQILGGFTAMMNIQRIFLKGTV